MPRKKRDILPGEDIHTVFRSIDRSFLFSEKRDQKVFVNALYRQKGRYHTPIYAWTGMSNHHHIFNQSPTQWPDDTEFGKMQNSLQKPMHIGHMLRDIFSLFARKFNKQKNREGGVIKDRTKTIRVQSGAQALTLLIYMFLNPVRAGIVKHPKDYPHSNFHQYAYGKSHMKGLFNVHPAYLALGKTFQQRQKRFMQLLEEALKTWAKKRWPGISATHGLGRGRSEKCYKTFLDFSAAWITLISVTLGERGPP